jgi:hypothetical protein
VSSHGTEYDKMVNEFRRSSGIDPSELILPTPLGPITVQSLNHLEGWRYDFYSIGYPGAEPVLTLGGPSVVLVDYTDEKGWIMLFNAIFRSPYGTLNFSIDNYVFSASPWQLNIANMIGSLNPVLVYANPYNPATPLGPLYGVGYSPSMPVPYASRLQITLNLPAGSPVAATTVFKAVVGRIWIVDKALFLKSIKRHIAEQMAGRRIDRYI